MFFIDLLQLNVSFFIIISLAVILMINKIFSQFLIKKKIHDLNEKNNKKLVYTSLGFSFTIITLLYLILFLLFVDTDNIYYQIKY